MGNVIRRDGKRNQATLSIVSVDKGTAITLLVANPIRVGYSLYNSGSEDVVIRYKPASEDNDIEGYLLASGEPKVFHDVNYTGEISSIRDDTLGNQTSDIKITEW